MTAAADTKSEDFERERRLDVRTEYAALASNFNYILTFRFTLLGLFLAALGLLIGPTRNPPAELYMLVFLITCAVYIIELRTRTLYQSLRERGAQIEYVHWGQSKEATLNGFFGRQLTHLADFHAKDGPDAVKIQPPRYPSILSWNFPLSGKILNHSFGLDLIYLGVLVYCLPAVLAYLRNFL
jgi:hypothetical protein